MVVVLLVVVLVVMVLFSPAVVVTELDLEAVVVLESLLHEGLLRCEGRDETVAFVEGLTGV